MSHVTSNVNVLNNFHFCSSNYHCRSDSCQLFNEQTKKKWAKKRRNCNRMTINSSLQQWKIRLNSQRFSIVTNLQSLSHSTAVPAIRNGNKMPRIFSQVKRNCNEEQSLVFLFVNNYCLLISFFSNYSLLFHINIFFFVCVCLCIKKEEKKKRIN